MIKYRSGAAIGAMLDGCEKTLNELKNLIRPLKVEQLFKIVEPMPFIGKELSSDEF